MARAAALAQIEGLAEDMRRLTDTMLAEHEGHLARDREVRGLVERIRDHREHGRDAEGNGDVQLEVDNARQIAYAMELVRQALAAKQPDGANGSEGQSRHVRR